MTIRKGEAWGETAPLPDDGVVVSSDLEARQVLTAARLEKRPLPVLGLLGGDLCRTLGGRGDATRLRSDAAVTFPVDLGEVLLDGRLHLFVAHVVARRRARTGSHLPHPAIELRRTRAAQFEFARPIPVRLDGETVGRFRSLSVRVEPDAVRVVV